MGGWGVGEGGGVGVVGGEFGGGGEMGGELGGGVEYYVGVFFEKEVERVFEYMGEDGLFV